MGKHNETNEYIEVLLMRTQQQINKIKQGQSNPFSVIDVPIVGLLDYYFENQHGVLQKTTGPRVLTVDPMHKIFYPLLSKLQNTIDPCKVRYMHYFDVTDPHILHNDDEFETPRTLSFLNNFNEIEIIDYSELKASECSWADGDGKMPVEAGHDILQSSCFVNYEKQNKFISNYLNNIF